MTAIWHRPQVIWSPNTKLLAPPFSAACTGWPLIIRPNVSFLTVVEQTTHHKITVHFTSSVPWIRETENQRLAWSNNAEENDYRARKEGMKQRRKNGGSNTGGRWGRQVWDGAEVKEWVDRGVEKKVVSAEMDRQKERKIYVGAGAWQRSRLMMGSGCHMLRPPLLGESLVSALAACRPTAVMQHPVEGGCLCWSRSAAHTQTDGRMYSQASLHCFLYDLLICTPTIRVHPTTCFSLQLQITKCNLSGINMWAASRFKKPGHYTWINSSTIIFTQPQCPVTLLLLCTALCEAVKHCSLTRI